MSSREQPEVQPEQGASHEDAGLSFQEIQANLANFQQRIQQQQAEREKKAEKKADELEIFRQQERLVYDQLQTAQEIVGEYEQAIENAKAEGATIGREDLEGYQRVQVLVEDIKRGLEEIQGKTKELIGERDVLGKMQERAESEESVRAVEEIDKKKMEEFLPQIDQLIKEIRAIPGQYAIERERVVQLVAARDQAHDSAYNFRNSIDEWQQNNYSVKLESLLRGESTVDETKQFFEAEREKLGWRERKKKKTAERILENLHLFSTAQETNRACNEASAHLFSKDWEPLKAVSERRQNLMQAAKVAEDEITKLLGSHRPHSNELPQWVDDVLKKGLGRDEGRNFGSILIATGNNDFWYY